MKRLIIAVFTIIACSAQAQDNTLLDSKFWQTKPSVEIVKAEIAKGNNPSQFTPSNHDPVVMAINNDVPIETIKYLLSQPGNDVAKLTHDGRIYIHWAAMRGNTDLMEYLLSKGSKATPVDNHGYTPLNFAANGSQQNTKVYDLCLANGADLKKDLNHDGANALLMAVANDKDFAVTNYFVSKGLSLNSTDAQGNTAFNYAARSGKIDVMKALLAKGVKFNDNAMIMASQGGRGGANTLELYQYLESLGIKPAAVAANGQNALHNIVRRPNQDEIIRYFLSKGVDVNKADADGNTPFMNAAASNRSIETLGLLLPKVKNINQANKKGVSALAFAIQSNSPEVVSYLIKNGADVKISDADGNNLAYYLIQSYRRGPQQGEFAAKLQILRDNGLDLVAPQKDGSTLYHLAVAKNSIDLLKLIESLNIDINSKNKEGFTPLHKAVMISKDDILIKYLLSAGARKDVKTGFDESAYDLASENESFSKNKVSIDFLK